jgi:hypothetical protein
MYPFNPIRNLPEVPNLSSQDTLVIFGEVFQRGYVNGMIEEAERLGMKVIYSTVGRRDSNNVLQKLSESELLEKNQSPIINIPLEAGFDLIPWKDGSTLVEQLSPYKMSQWKEIKVDMDELEEIIQKSNDDFMKRTKSFLEELKKELPKKGNIIFAHTMAGGIPRAKIVMPTMNRIFKGSGDRYQSSEEFINTNLGQICLKSFDEVTANTFDVLINATSDIRSEREKDGFSVGYTAFGYHGCDALVGDKYLWQSYAPYLQGWAKIKLENIAESHFKNKISAAVFNAPEILTNSSSVFLGVEVCLYPLLSALKKEGLPANHSIFKECQDKLKSPNTLNMIEEYVQEYLNSDTTQALTHFETWPHHNLPEQMEKMKAASAELIDMHLDSKDLITSNLSEVVFKACGALMIHKIINPTASVWWVGHDIVSKWAVKNLV